MNALSPAGTQWLLIPRAAATTTGTSAMSATVHASRDSRREAGVASRLPCRRSLSRVARGATAGPAIAALNTPDPDHNKAGSPKRLPAGRWLTTSPHLVGNPQLGGRHRDHGTTATLRSRHHAVELTDARCRRDVDSREAGDLEHQEGIVEKHEQVGTTDLSDLGPQPPLETGQFGFLLCT